uniref:Uncharacterized protein n=1 Tax=Avena sativa TaxID=4498 RepID=A0ACD5TU67_AVESA
MEPMEGSFQRLSVDSEATSAATPTATTVPAVDTTAPLYPGWVLLDEEEAYYNDCENGTTAEARMISGHTVKVTFFLADPPAVSNFCVHCPELEHADFRLVSRVVFSEKHLLLLHFKFTYRLFIAAADREPPPAQYSLYKAAAHGGQPSLTPIPTTTRPDNNIASFPSVLPLEDDYGNFLVADLAIKPTRGHYDLHIFSSKTNKWTARSLQLQASPAVPDDLPSLPDKVIALGAGAIGWIDLWRGIVVCNDVFEPDPVLRFIPLPKPEFNLRRRDSPRPVRDVTCCCDGFIKFVEMEHHPRQAR